MIILGIDPGTHTTGYGLIKKDGRKVTHVDNGVISPATKNSLPEKLIHIFNELKTIILKFEPDVVAIEEVFMATNARSALILGHARGAAMLAASESGLPVHEYSTREIKKAIVGYGNADKNQVAQMVKRLLNLPEVPAPDAADAIAAALCHEQTFKVIPAKRLCRNVIPVKRLCHNVIPVKTGIQKCLKLLDSRFRGNDKKGKNGYCDTVSKAGIQHLLKKQ